MVLVLARICGGTMTVVDEEGCAYWILSLDTTKTVQSGGSLQSGANSRHLSQVDLPRRYPLKHKRSFLWKIGGSRRVDDEEVWTCPPVGVARI